jgi:hypothetical protein
MREIFEVFLQTLDWTQPTLGENFQGTCRVFAKIPISDLGPELFLGGEVVVKRTLGHASGIGDVENAGSDKSGSMHRVLPGLQKLLAGGRISHQKKRPV